MKHILVIKLSALGDFIQATAAMKAIREHHKNDHITLLTTKPMRALAKDCPWFDAISIDQRRSFFNIPYLFNIRRKIQGFDMVYDLQTNDRTSLYYRLAGKPDWCGIARGCSHPHTDPNRDNLPSLDRLSGQLHAAGISYNHLPDLSYAAQNVDKLLKKHNLKKGHYTLLIPGAAPTRPEKKWPYFADLSSKLQSKGETVVLVGGPSETEILSGIESETGAINLCNQTNLNQLIGVLMSGKQFIGNDTGPSHMAAAVSLKGTVLFGKGSNPTIHAPRGRGIKTLQKDKISDITSAEIMETLS